MQALQVAVLSNGIVLGERVDLSDDGWLTPFMVRQALEELAEKVTASYDTVVVMMSGKPYLHHTGYRLDEPRDVAMMAEMISDELD